MTRIFLCIFLILAPPVSAGVVLDQYENLWSSVATVPIGGATEQQLAQTFEAGITGHLDHLQLVFTCEPDSVGLFTVEIQKVGADGLPNGGLLGSVSLDSSTLNLVPPALRDVVVPGVDLVAGNKYAIVMRAADTANCFASEGPIEAGMFGYPRGSGYFDARPNPPGWMLFQPQSLDLPFYTYMRVAELTGPLYCNFKDASGVPNDWLPNNVPICGCLSDRTSRVNRCWFSFPGFSLWREIEPFSGRPHRRLRWSVVPFDSQFPGMTIDESGIDGDFLSVPVAFPAGLRAGKPAHEVASYQGVAMESLVTIRFPGPSGEIKTVFRTRFEVPANNSAPE
jgi:hypothetical protein